MKKWGKDDFRGVVLLYKNNIIDCKIFIKEDGEWWKVRVGRSDNLGCFFNTLTPSVLATEKDALKAPTLNSENYRLAKLILTTALQTWRYKTIKDVAKKMDF